MRRGLPAVPALLALLGFSSLTSPPPAHAADEFTTDALRAGSWSLDFTIDEDFQIDSFEGALISATQHTSPGSAWRYGLTLSGTFADLSADQTALTDSVPAQLVDRDEDANAFTVGLSALRVLYPEVTGRVRPYFGFGPGISYSHFDAERDNDQTGSGGSLLHSEEHSNAWSASASFALGVEVFAARRVSIIGQYGASLSYTHLSREVSTGGPLSGGPGETEETMTDTQKVWQLGDDSVRFGVSAYF